MTDNPRPMPTRKPLPRLVTGPAPLDPRARAVAVPSDDDLAREAARDRLWTAALAYGAAREAAAPYDAYVMPRVVPATTSHVSVTVRQLRDAEREARKHLHAAYADYAAWAGGGGGGDKEG